MHIRLPLDTLLDSIADIGNFPFDPESGVTFDKRTLFIKGALSKYINRKNIPVAQALFPASSVHTVEGAGHWGMRYLQGFAFLTLTQRQPQCIARSRKNSSTSLRSLHREGLPEEADEYAISPMSYASRNR